MLSLEGLQRPTGWYECKGEYTIHIHYITGIKFFQTYQAQVVKKVMGAGLDKERGGSTTAIQQSMDVALPGFRDRLHNLHTEVHNVLKDVTRIDDKVSKFEQKQDAINRQIHHYLQHMAAFCLPTEADEATTTTTTTTTAGA
eukprot:jgi/Psemu1/19346/gm1.19346_g